MNDLRRKYIAALNKLDPKSAKDILDYVETLSVTNKPVQKTNTKDMGAIIGKWQRSQLIHKKICPTRMPFI